MAASVTSLPPGVHPAWSLLHSVRSARPLVHCITNFVSMDIMANTLLAAGASPAMVHSLEEIEAFSTLTSALLINVGTLTPAWVQSMTLAARTANSMEKPWVLDPVGCGATPYRTQVCRDLLTLGPWVVRGNASEILALSGAAGSTPTRGVDSTAAADGVALQAAKRLATTHNCTVAVSGPVDLVTDGQRVIEVHNGVPMLQAVTATGCAVTALCAAFCGLLESNEDGRKRAVDATAAALGCFGLAAELAVARGATGPGSLRVGLLDELFRLNPTNCTPAVELRIVKR